MARASASSAVTCGAAASANAPAAGAFLEAAGPQLAGTVGLAHAFRRTPARQRRGVNDVRHEIQRRMSKAGAHIRRREAVGAAADEAWHMCRQHDEHAWTAGPAELPAAFRNRDLCLAHAVYLTAIAEYLERGGQSRGSYLVVDEAGQWSLNAPGAFVDANILQVSVDGNLAPHTEWVPVRPMPDDDGWFETAWKAFRDGTVFD